MKKSEVFTFTSPNGVEVTAVVANIIRHEDDAWGILKIYICYAQNRLFTFVQKGHCGWDTDWEDKMEEPHYGKILVNYAILPDYDAILKAEQ